MTTTFSAAALARALGRPEPTDEQRAIIEAPLAPALVIAGAGSGKTETIAARVVWLIANGRIRPEEVLALTFTRRAAGELSGRIRERLAALHRVRRAAGPPAGVASTSGPVIATYNSFADRLTREHGGHAGLGEGSAVLSESAAWLMMRALVLGSADPRWEERPEALDTIIDAALRFARDAADNRADLDAVDAFAAEFVRVLELPSRSGRGPLKDVADAAGKVAALPLLTRLAREYAQAKRRRGVIDFSDQIAGALAVVRTPGVAERIRQEHRVILLDEYQDTSVAQTRLLSELFRGLPVMAVGDPHQAIYGWRGASAGNLAGFDDDFAAAAECARFTLSVSWRNGDQILGAAAAVAEPLRAATPLPIIPLRPRPDGASGAVEMAVAEDVDAEAERVAEWFVRVRRDRAERGLPTSGAVLARSRRHLSRFAEALGRCGVPHQLMGIGGLLSVPEVVDVVSALRVIADPGAGSALIRILEGPRFEVGLADIAALRDLARRIGSEPGSPEPGEVTIVEALDLLRRRPDDHPSLAAISRRGRTRLREAAEVIGELRRAASSSIPDLIRLVHSELRLDIERAANESQGPARAASAAFRSFLDEVQVYLAADDRASLPSLLAWLDHAERVDELSVRAEPPGEDVVQLLTIHGAKGLEWDAVAVVRMVEDELPAAPRELRGWLGFGVLPAPFRGDQRWIPCLEWRGAAIDTQQALRDEIRRYTEENRWQRRVEERRLAYVAVTRARERLLLSAAPRGGGSRPRAVSEFLREIAAAAGAVLPEPHSEHDPLLDRRRMLAWPQDPLGVRRERVRAAADAVLQAMTAPRPPADPDLALLLAERDERPEPPRLPVRIPASRMAEIAADLEAALARTERPVPQAPHPRARLGARFHRWVQARSGMGVAGPLPADALWAEEDADDAQERELRRLQRAFEASEWGGLTPIAVESEIHVPHPGPDGRDHMLVCRLDAVYRRADRGGRVEIVDWKTGSTPRDDRERAERMTQVELYRQAYAQRSGVPASQIDVALFYVGEGVVLRG